MRNNGRGAGFGIFLLTVGILWLLGMANIVNWYTLNAMFTLWPLILVAVGIGFIFRSNRIIRTLTWLVLLAVIISYGYFFQPSQSWIKYDLHFGDYKNSNVTIEKSPQVEKGELMLKYGAVRVTLNAGETENLVDANISKTLVDNNDDLKDDGKTATVEFRMKNETGINLAGLENLQNDFHLNKDVIWDLKLETGATTGNIDLSGLKVEKLDIGTGFTTLRLDMGSYNTVMKIGAGASSIDISLPGDTGMKARVNGLNSSNLKSQGWVKDGDWYYSPGYDSKIYKIEAEINNGVGSLTVENR